VVLILSSFLAVGGFEGGSGDEIQIFSFDGSLLTAVTSANYGFSVNSVDWLTSGTNIYLAVGGQLPDGGDEIQIFSFDGSLLKTVASVNYGSRVNSVDWLTSGTNIFLAVGGLNSTSPFDEIQIFSFDGSNLSLVDSEDYGAQVNSVNWLTSGTNTFLAVGGLTPSFPNDDISIFSFDGSILSLVDSEDAAPVSSVDWLTSGSNIYLAVGGFSTGKEIQIFSFDGSSLTTVASANYGTSGSFVLSVNWLTSCDNTFLAVGGDGPTNEIQIFRFDGSNLSGPIVSADYGGGFANSVAWLNENTLAVGGNLSSNQEIQVYSFFTGPSSNCLIENNKVCNTTGGTGIFGDSANNIFLRNIACNNDTNYSSGITNVFTDGLSFDPNLLDNISLPGAPLDICANTIDTPGVYKIDESGSCCITIDADDVVIDLQGHTLICTTGPAIEILSGHKNILIKNGSIKGDGSDDGIFTGTGCELVRVEDISIYSCDNGISFNGSSGTEIKGCSAVNCAFDSCNKGVFAQHLIKSVFENCIASNCVESGFEQLNSDFNVYDKCKALKTGEGSASSVDVSGFSSSAGRGNLYKECAAEGTNKISSDVGISVIGLSLLSTETESKVVHCVINSTDLVGSGTAHGIFTADTVSSCLIDSNKICNTTGGTGIVGDSGKNVFIRNIGFNNDVNFSPEITNVFTDGLSFDPNLLDNISLPGTTIPLSALDICANTIESPGVYKIDESGSCCITIDADDVVIDLQGHTLNCTTGPVIEILSGNKNILIKNGSIKGDGGNDGIFVNAACELVRVENIDIYDCDNGINFDGSLGSKIKGCSVVNCAFDSCNKGVFAQHLVKSVFENCIASNCVQSGFELCGSQFNVFDKCKALKTGQGSDASDDVSGFSSSGGRGNLYKECVAEGTDKILSSVGADAFGFSLLSTEAESKIINCIANSTSLLGTGTAYGIFLSDIAQELSLTATENYGTSVGSVNWLTSGTNTYLAVGGSTPTNGNEIQIFSFDGFFLTIVTSENYGDDVNSVEWLTSGTNTFLAVGGNVPSNGNEIQIFSFVGSSLSLLDSKDYGPQVQSVDWLTSGTNIFLAVGGQLAGGVGDEIQIFSFDGSLLTTVTSANYGTLVLSVNWLTSGTNTYLAVGGLTPDNGDEIQIFSFDGSILSLVDSEDFGTRASSVDWLTSESDIFLAVGGSSSGDEIKIFSFNGSSLSLVDSADYNGSVESVNWITSCANTFLAVGGFNPINGDEIQIFSFNGSILSGPIVSADYGGTLFVNSVAWLNDNTLAVGGEISSKQEIQLYSFSPGPATNCLIDSNKVCNTTGGTGIFGDSSDNVFIKNIAYQNDTNYSSGITNVFTDGLSSNPNLLDNISLPGTTTATNFDACATTITAPGVYTVDSADACCVIIDSDDVVVDLQGFTLNCTTGPAIEILSDHTNILIRNGSIRGDGSFDGIFVNNGCSFVRIKDINIYACDNGITFDGVASNKIKACSVVDCDFHDCNKGIFATFIKKCVFENCSAKNCAEAGFEQTFSEFNFYKKCNALEISGSDITKGAVGFSSSGGTANLYRECIVEGVKVEDSNFCNDAIGFLLTGTEGDMETASKIINCVVDSTEAIITVTFATGTAYGIQFDPVLSTTGDLSFVLTATFGDSGSIFEIEWSPNGQYVAFGSDSGNLKVLRFDGSSLTEVASHAFGSVILGLSWSPNGDFIAAGGFNSEVRVLSFDGSSLTLEVTHVHDTLVRQVDWSPDGRFIAFGGQPSAGGEVRVLRFDAPSTLTEVASFEQGNVVTSTVGWHPTGKYLAIGSNPAASEEIKVLEFTGSALIDIGANFEHSAINTYVRWSANGQYLAIVSHVFSGAEIVVLNFDGSSLLEVASRGNVSNVFGVDWSLNGKYLVIGTNIGAGQELQIFRFDGSTTLEQVAFLQEDDFINDVAWSPGSQHIAASISEDPSDFELKVFTVMDAPSKCFVKNNKVCNTTGHGLGISGGNDNCFMKNLGRGNDVDFSGGVVPVFTGGFSESPGVMDNIGDFDC